MNNPDKINLSNQNGLVLSDPNGGPVLHLVRDADDETAWKVMAAWWNHREYLASGGPVPGVLHASAGEVRIKLEPR